MKVYRKILPMLAAVLVLSAAIQPALAYFTTYARAKGGYTIHQGSTTEIDEGFRDWTKFVTITNEQGEPVFVRARAFAGSTLTLVYSGEGWSRGEDGWYYYADPLAAGESTSDTLNVSIQGIPDAAEDAAFNVAVVYESTPVLYRADGSAYADWDMILDQGGDRG